MTRDYALKLVREKLQNNNLFKHCLAAEACLIALAEKFGESAEKWGLTGLLHDIDYEETSGRPSQHALVGAQFLEKLHLDADIIHAIKCHAGHVAPESKLDWALFATDPLTGLIVASALMHPEKKLKPLDTDFVLRRFREKRFAAGANREQIASCSNLGLELNEFVDICLKGMQGIADHLGL
jgi:putative nucleotidyltransferase with HDIG domain